MSLLSIAHLGNPILRQKATQVSKEELVSAEFQKFISDLVETMREYDGVGLAATQVHVLKKVFVFEVASNLRYQKQEGIPLTIVVNPLLEKLSEKIEEDFEGCLSIPGMVAKVPRHLSLTLKGLTREGKPLEMELSGFTARVAQHENDHLNGIVYLDRVVDKHSIAFDREHRKFSLLR
jgi:peptide deformylase